jgi:lipoate-protein ligase A
MGVECYYRSVSLESVSSSIWESAKPIVVLGLGGRIEEQVNQPACAADNIEILRRSSGGGAVVLAPGCLAYTLLFSLEDHPHLRNVARSFHEILTPIAEALNAEIQGQSDLVYQGRKVSGNAQRRTATTLLHHGTLLYRFDPALAARYLLEPCRQPEYRRRRPHTEFLGNLPYSAEEIKQRLTVVYSQIR